MDDPGWSSFWAPLAVGAILWIAAEGVRWLIVSPVVRRRQRRRRIVSLMGRAESLVARAVTDGLYDEAWITGDMSPLSSMRREYDSITVEALDLFEWGEELVAFWAAAEFYGGFIDPIYALESTGVSREARADGLPLLSPYSPPNWMAPRAELLLDWATRWWPWVNGNARGPVFGGMAGDFGDGSRHDVITPYSEVPGDMLLPFVWRLRDRRSSDRIDWRASMTALPDRSQYGL